MHSLCTKFGMPLNEYERRVKPINRYFHEMAELMLLSQLGVLPIVRDEDEDEFDTGSRVHR